MCPRCGSGNVSGPSRYGNCVCNVCDSIWTCGDSEEDDGWIYDEEGDIDEEEEED